MATVAIADGAILRAKLSRPLQAYFDTAPGVSYNSGTGVLDLDLTALYGPNPLDGDTYIFAAPANISSGSTNLSIRINSGSAPILLVKTDNTPVVPSDLTSSQKYVATLVNDRWFLTAGLADDTGTNNYADTAALSLNATDQLVATIGRTGTLADIVSAPLTLPSGATGIQTITPGVGIDVTASGTERTVTLESQYRGIQLGIEALPDFNLFGGFYGITLNISGLSFQAGDHPTGTTFSFQIPSPVEDLGTDASELAFRPGTSGALQAIVSQANGFALTRGDLIPGALHTVRKEPIDYVLIEPTAVVDNDTLDISTPANESPIEAVSRQAAATAIAAIVTSSGVSSIASADSNIAVSPATGNVELTLADQVNAWTWYNIGVADFTANLITIEAPSSYNAEKRGDFYSFHLNISGDPTGDVSIRRSSSATTWPLRDGGARRVQAEDLSRSLYQVIFNGSDAYYVTNYPQEFEFPDNGNARQFIIAQSDVGGTVDAVTISTGEDITLQNGDEFYFISPGVNTGDVTITVDSNATFELVKSDGLGTRIQMGVGDMRQHGHDLIRYTEGFADEFVWESAIQGTAAASNVGILAGNLVALNSAAVIDSDRLGTGGAAGEVLTWASGTATWQAAGAVGVRGTRRQWFVADTDVTGAGNNITLNPQDAALTALQDGDTFVFRPNDDIGTSNSVNVLIRQTSPAKTVQRSNGAGGFTNVVIGDWTTGDLVVLQYSLGLDRLVWLGG